MRNVLAIAWLRIRGATAARLPWLAPLAFVAGIGCALWAPGTSAAARAAAADDVALGGVAAVSLIAVLVVAATSFAGEVKSGIAQTLLSAPLSRAAVVSGGALGHAAFGMLLALALGAAATIGLDVGGLGTRAREPVRPMRAVQLIGADAGTTGRDDGVVVLGRGSPEIRGRFVVPDGLREGDVLRFHLAPRKQIDSSDWALGGALDATVSRPGAPAATAEFARRVTFKAGTPFEVRIPLAELAPGDEAELVLRHVSGGWKLRFRPGTVEVGGARELFAWNVAKASLCLLPLLAMAAAAGAAASARLGAGASMALVLFLLLLVAGRDVIVDGAAFVVDQAGLAASIAQDPGHGEPGHDHAAHEAHGHLVDVTPAQVALARGALVAMEAVPDATTFWRFGDLAAARAVTPRDVGRALTAGLVPCAGLLVASWLLLRRRELQPG